MSVALLAWLFAALLGVPLFAVLAGLAWSGFSSTGTGVVVLAEEAYKLAGSPHLVTIPLFTFAGFLMARSGAGVRLVDVMRAWLGWLPGGAAIVVVATCAFFTTFTGASGVTIVALGGLLVPLLTSQGYPERSAIGLVTASGAIGLLFPPSLPLVLYGIVAAVDIDALFVAGIVPGLVMMGLLAAYAVAGAVSGGVPRTTFALRPALRAAWAAKWELAVPAVVLLGIYGVPGVTAGLVTVAEASALCAAWLVWVEVGIHRDITLRPSQDGRPSLASVAVEAGTMVGAILLILAVALGLTNYLVQEEVPTRILGWMQEHVHDRVTFLAVLTAFLLAVGCLMDVFSAIVVVVPLVAPVAAEYGVHPLHLAVLFLANLEVGYLTPPVGLNLFIAALAFGRPVGAIMRMTVPFLLVLLLALLVVTFVPALVVGTTP